MKSLLLAMIFVCGLAANIAWSQESDAFVDVGGGDRLHFHILKGRGMPILFEAGGGDDATVWATIAKPVWNITDATIITYDRAGFGKSELNASEHAIDKHGIRHGVEELEEALKRLGYSGSMVLVAHSYGGLYAKLFAARHPDLVKAAVFVDASSACWFTDEWLKNFEKNEQGTKKPNSVNLGNYYQSANLPATVELMRTTPFPSTIPVIDLVSEHPPFSNAEDIARWKECHRQFVDAASNREGITAYESGHYIFKDNPPLVVNAIIKAYVGVAARQQADEIMRRAINYSIQLANDFKRQQVAAAAPR